MCRKEKTFASDTWIIFAYIKNPKFSSLYSGLKNVIKSDLAAIASRCILFIYYDVCDFLCIQGRKESNSPTLFFPSLTPLHNGLTDNILWLEAMLLKEEKNERLSIKSDPRVQANVAASWSKYYFIGIIRPFLWAAILNHALDDKCTLVTFNTLCPGAANRTSGWGCVWRRAPWLTVLGQWLLRAAHATVLPEGSKQPGSSSTSTIPGPMRRPVRAQHQNRNNSARRRRRRAGVHLLPGWCLTAALLHPAELSRRCRMVLSSLCSHQLPTPSPEGEKFGQFLPAPWQPLYRCINAINCWSRAMETSSKWKMKLFWAKWEKTVVFFAAAVCIVQTVARGDALRR